MGQFSGSSNPRTAWLLKTGQIGCPETSVITTNLRCVISQKTEDLICTVAGNWSRGGNGIVKGKAVPLHAWSGPEGSRKLRFPDFMTTAQDGGKVVSLTHRPPLPPGNTLGTHFCWRLSRPEGLCHWEIPVTPSGIEPATCRFVATKRPNWNRIDHYLHETSDDFRACSVAAALWLHSAVHLMQFIMINVLYFYVSTFRSMCVWWQYGCFL
jgi:hypothetical protein